MIPDDFVVLEPRAGLELGQVAEYVLFLHTGKVLPGYVKGCQNCVTDSQKNLPERLGHISRIPEGCRRGIANVLRGAELKFNNSGGDSSDVQAQLQEGVVEIHSNDSGFLAIKGDSTAVAWGATDRPGSLTNFRVLLRPGVKEVCANSAKWVVILCDGSVAIWPRTGAAAVEGVLNAGASGTTGASPEKRVGSLKASVQAFAALRDDGSVFAWGLSAYGGDTSEVHTQLTDVTEVHACTAAVKRCGQVVAWGGETKELLRLKLRGEIHEIYTQGSTYAAVRNTGYLRCGGPGRQDPIPNDVRRSLRSGVDDDAVRIVRM
jgi:hypothetical protein